MTASTDPADDAGGRSEVTAADIADAVLAQVGEAIALTPTDRAGARALLAATWATVGEAGDALHRCAIAHAMADVEDGARDELVWDLRALAAARGLDDARLAAAGMAASVEELLSSLHLNLADVYRRLGESAAALGHAAEARAALARAGTDRGSQMIRDALDRVTSSLHADCGHGHERPGAGS